MLLYNLISKESVEPLSSVESSAFSVAASGPVSISTTGLHSVRNVTQDIEGTTVLASPDDVILVTSIAPGTNSTSSFINVTQDDVIVGSYAVTTISTSVYDERYLTQPSWFTHLATRPSGGFYLDKFDGTESDYTLTSLSKESGFAITTNTFLVLDYHYNKAYLYNDVLECIESVSIPNPTDHVVFYPSIFARHAILSSNYVYIYNNALVPLDSILVPGAKSLCLSEDTNEIFVLGYNGGHTLYTITFNEQGDLSDTYEWLDVAIESPLSLALIEGLPYFISADKIYDISGAVVYSHSTVISSVYFIQDQIWVISDYFDVSSSYVLLDSDFNVVSDESAPVHGLMNLVEHDGDIYAATFTNSVINLTTGEVKDSSHRVQGLESIEDELYVLGMYDNLPDRAILADTYPKDFTFEDISGMPNTQVDTPTLTVGGLNQSVDFMLNSRWAGRATVLHNGVDVEGTSVLGVVVGDTLAIRVTMAGEFGIIDTITYTLGERAASFTAEVKPKDWVPDDIVFDPVYNADLSEVYTSNAILLSGIEDTMIVSVSEGYVVVNGAPYDESATVQNGDSLAIRGSSPDGVGDTTTIAVDFGAQVSSVFSISTGSFSSPDMGLFFPSLHYIEANTTVRSVVQFAKASGPISVPDIYGATLIINDVDVGQSALVSVGDKVEVEVTTGPHFELGYHVPVVTNFTTYSWIVYTDEGYTVDLDFGVFVGDHGTFAESNTVALEDFPDDIPVWVTFPLDTHPYVNGESVLPEQLTNYKGLLEVPYTLALTNQDTVKLEGHFLAGRPDREVIFNWGQFSSYWRALSNPLDPMVVYKNQHGFAHVLDSTLSARRAEAHTSLKVSAKSVRLSTHETIRVTNASVQVSPSSTALRVPKSTPKAVSNGSYYAKSLESRTVTPTVKAIEAKQSRFISDSVESVDELGPRKVVYDQLVSLDAVVPVQVSGLTVGKIDSKDGIHISATILAQSDNHSPRYISYLIDTYAGKDVRGLRQNIYFGQLNSFAKIVTDDYTFNPPTPSYRSWLTQITISSEPARYEDRSFRTVPPREFLKGNLFSDRSYPMPPPRHTVQSDAYYTFLVEAVYVTYNLERRISTRFKHVSDTEPRLVKIKPTHRVGRLAASVVSVPSHIQDSAPRKIPMVPRYDSRSFRGIAGKFAHVAVRPSASFIPKAILRTQSGSMKLPRKVAKHSTPSVYYFSSLQAYAVDTHFMVDIDSPIFVDAILTDYEIGSDLGYFDTELEALQDATQVWGFDAGDVYALELPNGKWVWLQTVPCENMCNACPPVGYVRGG